MERIHIDNRIPSVNTCWINDTLAEISPSYSTANFTANFFKYESKNETLNFSITRIKSWLNKKRRVASDKISKHKSQEKEKRKRIRLIRNHYYGKRRKKWDYPEYIIKFFAFDHYFSRWRNVQWTKSKKLDNSNYEIELSKKKKRKKCFLKITQKLLRN